MSSTTSTSARTACLRVTQQEYDALQSEAARQGYKLSHLMRHRIFGKSVQSNESNGVKPDKSSLGAIIGQLSIISRELGENGIHIRLIADSLDEGFRNAFGLDFCLRLLERLSHELLKALACAQEDIHETRNLAHAPPERVL